MSNPRFIHREVCYLLDKINGLDVATPCRFDDKKRSWAIACTTYASLLFKAQLVDTTGKPRTQIARILFGVDSPEEKEKTFRLICKSKYPQLRIQEPLSISPAPIE